MVMLLGDLSQIRADIRALRNLGDDLSQPKVWERGLRAAASFARYGLPFAWKRTQPYFPAKGDESFRHWESLMVAEWYGRAIAQVAYRARLDQVDWQNLHDFLDPNLRPLPTTPGANLIHDIASEWEDELIAIAKSCDWSTPLLIGEYSNQELSSSALIAIDSVSAAVASTQARTEEERELFYYLLARMGITGSTPLCEAKADVEMASRTGSWGRRALDVNSRKSGFRCSSLHADTDPVRASIRSEYTKARQSLFLAANVVDIHYA